MTWTQESPLCVQMEMDPRIVHSLGHSFWHFPVHCLYCSQKNRVLTFFFVYVTIPLSVVSWFQIPVLLCHLGPSWVSSLLALSLCFFSAHTGTWSDHIQLVALVTLWPAVILQQRWLFSPGSGCHLIGEPSLVWTLRSHSACPLSKLDSLLHLSLLKKNTFIQLFNFHWLEAAFFATLGVAQNEDFSALCHDL